LSLLQSRFPPRPNYALLSRGLCLSRSILAAPAGVVAERWAGAAFFPVHGRWRPCRLLPADACEPHPWEGHGRESARLIRIRDAQLESYQFAGSAKVRGQTLLFPLSVFPRLIAHAVNRRPTAVYHCRCSTWARKFLCSGQNEDNPPFSTRVFPFLMSFWFSWTGQQTGVGLSRRT